MTALIGLWKADVYMLIARSPGQVMQQVTVRSFEIPKAQFAGHTGAQQEKNLV